MKRLLQQICDLRYGVTGRPLSFEDVDDYQQRLVMHGFLPVPKDVRDFLTVYNGFMTEGRVIFGMDASRHFMYDILGENAFAENPYPEKWLFIGATETTFVGWSEDDKSYLLIDKSSFAVLHRLESFQDAVRYVLRIDD